MIRKGHLLTRSPKGAANKKGGKKMGLVAKMIAVFGFPVFLYMGATQAPNLHIRLMQGESLEEIQ